MFYPTCEDFFVSRYGAALPRLRIILFLDIDGVLRMRKGPVPREIIKILRTLSAQHQVHIALITGAPLYQLPQEILWPHVELWRAFAESGGVERLPDGNAVPETAIVGAFQNFVELLKLDAQDGLARIPSLGKTIICEGQRYTGFTAIMGKTYAPYPNSISTAEHQEVHKWLADIIHAHAFPFVLLHGYELTYSYIDVIHQAIGKAQCVRRLMDEMPHDAALYIGDGAGDEEATELMGVIPVALENSTVRIKQQGKQRGFTVKKGGPDGTYEFLTALMDFLQQTQTI